ncbi:MAG: sigma-54-dependent Fis family transcriptional regulator [Planctomycetes bacterium]|nr:sigma-54-dependent Fis family transcriptional regulator [Planctomycetota bacterium]
MSEHHILIVDDESDLRWVLRGLFEDAGFVVAEAADGEEALSLVAEHVPDVVLSDVRMPKMSGDRLLHLLRQREPDLPVILLSAVEDIATAVGAIKDGAFDYQAKPFDGQRLLLACERAAEQHCLRREVQALRRAHPDAACDFGTSDKAREVRRQIELVAAQTSVAVLLTGESGTGKEVAARAVHALSPVADGPFVAVDCGALPEPLLESQLFGHEKGAFTGADRSRQGLFSMANGGTLFLDELGNLPLALQAKLLRALQERRVTPVGGSRPVPFDARLIAATNSELESSVQDGSFRVDLYHRIAEFSITLPPLRERRDDIAPFAELFLAEANREMGRRFIGFTAAATAALRQETWQGNLRELRNVVRRAVLSGSELELDVGDLQLSSAQRGDVMTPIDSGASLAELVRAASDELEARILRETIESCGGNKAAAARALRIDYTTLHRKLKRHSLPL